MKSNIKLTVYLTTVIMSEALAKGIGAMRPAGLAGIDDATFTRAMLERDTTLSVDEWPLCHLNHVASAPRSDSVEVFYCV
ncbi:hypothetical protein F4859DRAFT_491972 [Xylaria cf. heliscus]|nr:hypothetical protein F4859DRAFT_491972 [Xylaria cf. heliscus]